jgi:hypothetical protein
MLLGLGQSGPDHAVGKVRLDRDVGQGGDVAAQRFELCQKLPIRLAGRQVLFDLGPLGGGQLVIKKCTEQFVWEFAFHNNQPCRYT